MYSSDTSAHSWKQLQDSSKPLLLKYKVRLVLVGHEHMFEAIGPVHGNKLVSKIESVYRTSKMGNGTLHWVIGCEGALIHEDLIQPKPDWSQYRLDEYGFGVLNLVNQSYLEFEYKPLSNDQPFKVAIIRDD